MAKRKRKNVQPKADVMDAWLFDDQEDLCSIVTMALVGLPNERQACHALTQLYCAGWTLTAHHSDAILFFGRGDDETLLVRLSDMTAEIGQGLPGVHQPHLPHPGFSGVLPDLPLRPVMKRAVQLGENAPDPVFIRSLHGEFRLDIHAYLSLMAFGDASDADTFGTIGTGTCGKYH